MEGDEPTLSEEAMVIPPFPEVASSGNYQPVDALEPDETEASTLQAPVMESAKLDDKAPCGRSREYYETLFHELASSGRLQPGWPEGGLDFNKKGTMRVVTGFAQQCVMLAKSMTVPRDLRPCLVGSLLQSFGVGKESIDYEDIFDFSMIVLTELDVRQ